MSEPIFERKWLEKAKKYCEYKKYSFNKILKLLKSCGEDNIVFLKDNEENKRLDWKENIPLSIVLFIRNINNRDDYFFPKNIINIEKKENFDYITPNNNYPKTSPKFKYIYREIINNTEYMVSDIIEEYKQ